jgi:geranylgeranyl diphosphate synthase, type II
MSSSRVLAGHEAFDLEHYLADCRVAVLDEIRRLIPNQAEQERALYDLILDYPLREAKGLRPALAIATCRAFGGKLEAILPTAAVLELYHNAFLIHDDVEDESLMRRGRATLHQEHGIPVAVNVGDAMLALSLEPLLKNMTVIGLGPSLLVLQAVARMSRESVEGQALELDWIRKGVWDLGDEDYVTMVTKKTGWYSFMTPMIVGALASGDSSKERAETLTSFGQALGVAFQIQDDILNLAGDVEGYGKEIGGDLWEGKRTVIILHALRTASAPDRQRAVDILSLARPSVTAEADGERLEQLLEAEVSNGSLSDAGRERLRAGLRSQHPTKTLEQVRWLRDLIERSESLDYARKVAGHWADRASCELERLSSFLPASRHRQVLESLVDYVHRRVR